MGWGVVETWGYVVGRQICLNCCTSILPLVALCTNHNCIKKKKKTLKYFSEKIRLDISCESSA